MPGEYVFEMELQQALEGPAGGLRFLTLNGEANREGLAGSRLNNCPTLAG